MGIGGPPGGMPGGMPMGIGGPPGGMPMGMGGAPGGMPMGSGGPPGMPGGAPMGSGGPPASTPKCAASGANGTSPPFCCSRRKLACIISAIAESAELGPDPTGPAAGFGVLPRLTGSGRSPGMPIGGIDGMPPSSAPGIGVSTPMPGGREPMPPRSPSMPGGAGGGPPGSGTSAYGGGAFGSGAAPSGGGGPPGRGMSLMLVAARLLGRRPWQARVRPGARG